MPTGSWLITQCQNHENAQTTKPVPQKNRHWRKQKQTERNYDRINQDIWPEAWVRTQKQKIIHVNMRPYTSNPFKYTWGFTMVKSSSKNKSAGTDRMSGVPFTQSVSDSRNTLHWNNSLINFNVNEECAINTLESHGSLKTLRIFQTAILLTAGRGCYSNGCLKKNNNNWILSRNAL